MQMCVFYLFHLCYFVITSTRSTSTEAARSGENEKKKRMKKSPSCVHVLHATLNLVISRCCFAECDKKIKWTKI